MTGKMDLDVYLEAFYKGKVDYEGPPLSCTQDTHILLFSLSRKGRDTGTEVSSCLGVSILLLYLINYRLI
jgi:hypothetical protein